MKIDKQLELVLEDIINYLYKKGWTERRVVQDYLKLQYDLGTTQCYKLIGKAKEYFAQNSIETNTTLLEDCIEILKENRSKAFEQNNLKEVRECTKEIAKLEQLYIQKLDITSQGEKIILNINKGKSGD